ncbi:Hypothetical protein FKW44_010280 [Caligus rogercresseyi]|uniref:Uncharacterized protein n=1 Tax=Caligus rogercresseyi TaxID=217165 RepID=A0A7T8K7Y2_CALRO|nr:Hypothetical protein FKW44_010280 [Caligus rogercresseyi]
MRLLKSSSSTVFDHHQRGEEDSSKSQRNPKVTRRKRTRSTWLPSRGPSKIEDRSW